MAKVVINVRELPCYPTMGALLRYKKETGKEFAEIKEGDLSDFITYIYCCAASACNREGIEFGMDLMAFADALDQSDLTSLSEAIVSAPADNKKKGATKKH